jgi:hypothetical protein
METNTRINMRNYKTQLNRRHFEIVAASVRNTDMPADVRERVASQLASELSSTNPRFDRQRFIRACGCE